MKVREHIPLEQGLRLPGAKYDFPKPCQRAYSIRTRIKTCRSNLDWNKHNTVREHIPLEQGLRLFNISAKFLQGLSESIFH